MSMESSLKPYLDKIREERLSGVKVKDLAEKYNVTYHVMTSFLSNNNIVLRGNPNDPKIINKIVNDYKNGVSYEIIARNVHLDKAHVRNIITQNGVEIRSKSHAFQKYYIDEHYFDNMDTPNQAYILGILYADGNRTISKNHYSVTLKLQERDKDILEKIKYEIKSERPLKFNDCSKCEGNVQDQWSLIIDNKHIGQTLEKYGIVPNKTFKLHFPKFLDKSLLPHFFRGFWDGDGTISHNYKKYATGCCGFDELMFEIKDFIENELKIPVRTWYQNTPSGRVVSLFIFGKENSKIFLDYIYENADKYLYMDRKYNYYLDMYYNNSQ